MTSVSLATEIPKSVQVHGFAALNPLVTTGNNLFGQSKDELSLDFWELGVNGSWRPQQDFLISAQLTSRKAGENDDGKVRLDYGLIDYSPISTPTLKVGVRGGRVLNPLGFFNETRDVAFTRSSILLPQSIYFDRTRDFSLASDAIQFYSDIRSDIGDFYFQANIGYPRTGAVGVEQALLGRDFPGRLDSNLSFLGRLLYERDGGRWRLGMSGGHVGVSYDPDGLSDPLPSGEILFKPLIFSIQYNAEHFSLTSEFGPRAFNTKGFGRARSQTVGESMYVEGLYRFTPRWEGFLRYDVLFSDRDDRDGKQYQATTGLPSYFRYAKDLTAGVTWRFKQWGLARLEYHYVNGIAWLPLEDNPNPSDISRYWSIFGLQFAVRF
ncbi:hypothetical protein [Halochromatium roseum]|uniref:hypothetical protein n=1 Tax=Halochromatium roseum TaxID=391920 RepID=UPI0019126A69|nr:hypothetical protein [Halochromatium roseum]